MAAYTSERIISVRHWSEWLFSFQTTRSPSLRFDSGQFVMLGLEQGARRIVRAYSIASASYEEHLEFYSIKVPDGPLTSRLQRIAPGDALLVSTKPTGTLLLSDLRAGKRLFMVATGTGVAPFASLLRDPETYERFEQVVLVRGGRTRSDLAYGDDVVSRLRTSEFLGEAARHQLRDYRSLTREPYLVQGRVTTLLAQDRVTSDLEIAPLSTSTDRFMICGNMRMLADATTILGRRGFVASPEIGTAGDYVVERAFVDASTTESRLQPTGTGP